MNCFLDNKVPTFLHDYLVCSLSVFMSKTVGFYLTDLYLTSSFIISTNKIVFPKSCSREQKC